MSQAREKLHSAREALNPILGRRKPTTEQELDECVQTLEDLKNACSRLFGVPPEERTKRLVMIHESFDEVITRIKNRSRDKS